MVKLFKYEGYRVVISEEALLLKPFSKLWNRDVSEDKQVALAELGFIYFFCDPRSDYQYITDVEQRMETIKKDEGMPVKWKPDKCVREAISFYESFKPTSALLLEDTRYAVDKLRTLLRNIDLTKTDEKGRPLYTLNTITTTIKQIPVLVKDLDEAEKTLSKELTAEGKVRGSGEKTILEDSLLL